jgi:hypothetical protein
MIYEPPNYVIRCAELEALLAGTERKLKHVEETLRDRFAMAAMLQLTISSDDGTVLPFPIIARDCYALADCMLKAREEKP